MADLICVKTFDSTGEAEAAHSLLTSQGIEAIVESSETGGMTPGVASDCRLSVHCSQTNSVSNRFWNTPPDNIVGRCGCRRQTCTMAHASARWNFIAIDEASTPASRSATSWAIIGRQSTSRGCPSCKEIL